MSICLLVLFLPYTLRYLRNNPTFIGEDSYYHTRVAKAILENKASFYDEQAYGNRPYDLNPYHFMLAGLGHFTSINRASKALPMILGLLSVLLMFMITGKMKLNWKLRLLFISVWIISPIFIYTYTVSTPLCLILLINLAGLYFFLNKGKLSLVISTILFSFVPLFGLYQIIIPIMLLLLVSIGKKQKIRAFYITMSVMISIAVIYNVYLLVVHNPLPQAMYIEKDLVRSLISDLGGKIGLGAFSVVLLLVGIFLMWDKRKENYPAYLMLIILSLLCIFVHFEIIIFLNLVVAYFCAAGALNLARRGWDLKLIKTFTMVLIICGFLFSTVSYINREASMEPNNEIASTFSWLNNNTDENEYVLSHPSNGFWIEYFGNRSPITDGMTVITKDSSKLSKISNEIFYSRDLNTTLEDLEGLNVGYIIIDRKMQSGEVWSKKKEGLLFLLRNSETFKKAYNSTSIDIWEIIKRGD